MTSWRGRRSLRAATTSLLAVATVTGLTVAFWPAGTPDDPNGDTKAISGETPPANRVETNRGIDGILDELAAGTAQKSAPRSARATAPGETDTASRPEPRNVARTKRAEPTTSSSDGLSREERIRRKAMTPHPPPPKTTVIAPDVQESIERSENQPPIELGTLEPDPPESSG